MKKRSQQGSSHAVVITVLVLALAVALGWIFYQNFIAKERVKTEIDLIMANKSDKKAEDERAEGTQVLPEGYVAYRDENLGFSLAYPKEWGNLKRAQTQSSTGRIGANGENTEALVDAEGRVRIAVYEKDSFRVNLQSGYIKRFQSGTVVGNYGSNTEDEIVSPIAGTNVYKDGGGETGDVSISWANIFFESGDSVVYVYSGTNDIQARIAKSVKVHN